jgi:hypothetical protein
VVTNEVEESDLGPAESPIYSNYIKNLWKAHTRAGGVQSPRRSRENTDGPLSSKVEQLPPAAKSPPMAVEKARTVKTAG